MENISQVSISVDTFTTRIVALHYYNVFLESGQAIRKKKTNVLGFLRVTLKDCAWQWPDFAGVQTVYY